jgi:hypothetical protein
MNQQQHGFIALIAVLVVGAAATAIGVGMLLVGTDNQRLTFVAQTGAQARQLATACAEESLQIINSNTFYTGTGTLTLSGNTCTYTVTNTGGNNRVIAVVATVQNSTKKLKLYATIGASNINVTSWQEVADI